MTGQELIDWIYKNNAEDCRIVIQDPWDSFGVERLFVNEGNVRIEKIRDEYRILSVEEGEKVIAII